jgi:thioredoxin-like negative regulator of GroEL
MRALSPRREKMGFLKRLLGMETRPGEPEPLSDELFEETVEKSDLPVFVFFFNLWCSSCQVMHGLLNEVGPEYIGQAKFYKMDATRSPRTAVALELRGVPVLIAFPRDSARDMVTGLMDITQLRRWIDSHLPGGEG